MIDNKNEIFPITDAEGNISGHITRGEAHSGSHILHPVVHLHIFNNRGELYLQQRPIWKDIQPGRWDTAVGGHVDYTECLKDNGELVKNLDICITRSLYREAYEELNIKDFSPKFITKYVFEGIYETELVYVFTTIYNDVITPSTNELDGGKFWTLTDIHNNIGKGIFTPNFENEYIEIVIKNTPHI